MVSVSSRALHPFPDVERSHLMFLAFRGRIVHENEESEIWSSFLWNVEGSYPILIFNCCCMIVDSITPLLPYVWNFFPLSFTASQVALLAVTSVISFTTSASIAIGTHVPVSSCHWLIRRISVSLSFIFRDLTISSLQLFYDWDQQHRMNGVLASLLIFVYYFIGTLILKIPLP